MAEIDKEAFPPPGVDLSHPSVARVYDYYLGGTTNWEIDREFGDRVLAQFPQVKTLARANRMYLHRVVRHLVKQGVRQFIDIGAGVPTMGPTHEIADEVAPGEVHVAYVDYEPAAVAHCRSLLHEHGDEKRQTVIHADLRNPDALWDKVRDTGVIDLTQPVALLLIAVLHVRQPPAPGSDSTDDLGPAVVARYRDLLAEGSYLAISHLTNDGIPDEFVPLLTNLKAMYEKSSSPAMWRSRAEITEFFGDFTLLDPGVTWAPLWHPEEVGSNDIAIELNSPDESILLTGAARKESATSAD